MKKLLTVILLILTIVFAFGCTPNQSENEIIPYDEIYQQNESISQYNNAEFLGDFGENVLPYKVKGDYSDAYLNEYNLIILQKSVIEDSKQITYYGFFSTDKKELIIPIEYLDFEVRHGFIALRDKNDIITLYNTSGDVILSKDSGLKSTDLNKKLRAISKDYFAVQSSTLMGFCNIYNAKGQKVLKPDKSEYFILGTPSSLKACDDYIIRTQLADDSDSGKKEIDIFTMPNNKPNINGQFKGTVSDSVLNAFYLGDDKFYCYDIYDGDEEGHQYVDLDGEYRKASVWEYNAKTDEIKALSLDVIFTVVINSYYAEEDGLNLDIDAFLKEGYSYVSVGLIRDKEKKTTYDQFIIDSDCNILISMVSVLGTNVEYDNERKDYQDVLLTYISEIGFSSTTTGDLLLYDLKGNVVLKCEGEHSNVFYNNGIVTARKTYNINDETIYYYTAYDLTGKTLFNAKDRKYTAMTAFVGNYALAERRDNRNKSICVLVDRNGAEHAITDVVAQTFDGQFIYKAGCYVYQDVRDVRDFYGVKNYEGDTIIKADCAKIVLAKYGINDIIVYAQKDNGEYCAYKIKN